MKSKNLLSYKSCNLPKNPVIIGNLALKPIIAQPVEYEKPKILKLVIGKKKNNIFCGCWQVANQEDAC